MKIYQTVKKIQQVVQVGAANFLFRVRPAARVRSVFSLVFPFLRPSVSTRTAFSTTTTERPSVRAQQLTSGSVAAMVDAAGKVTQINTGTLVSASDLGVLSTVARYLVTIPVRAASRITQSVSGMSIYSARSAVRFTPQSNGSLNKPQQLPAGNVLQMVLSLVHNRGSSAVAGYTVNGRNDWTNAANAQGNQNGTNATIAGSSGLGGLTANAGGLDFAYADFVGKNELTITKAELRFYGALSGVVLGNGTLSLRWSRDGSAGNRLSLQTLTANQSFATTPLAFDILDTTLGGGRTNGIRNWTDLNTVAAQAEFVGAVLSGASAAIDAVHIYVEATKTDTL